MIISFLQNKIQLVPTMKKGPRKGEPDSPFPEPYTFIDPPVHFSFSQSAHGDHPKIKTHLVCPSSQRQVHEAPACCQKVSPQFLTDSAPPTAHHCWKSHNH